jgi:hypothetical protein
MSRILKYFNESIEIEQVLQQLNPLYQTLDSVQSQEFTLPKMNDLNNYDKLIYIHNINENPGKIKEPQQLNGIQIYIVNYNKPNMGITCNVRILNKNVNKWIEKEGKFTSIDMLLEYLVELNIELNQDLK